MDKELLNTDTVDLQKADTTPFYSYRKVIKCLSDGISLYTDNIWQFTRLTMPMVLPAALLAAVFAALTNGWLIVLGLIFLFVYPFYRCVTYSFVIKKCVVGKDSLPFSEIYKFAWRKSPRMLLFANIVQWFIILATSFCIAPFYWLPESLPLIVVKVVLLIVAILAQLILCLPTELAVPAVMLNRGNMLTDFFTGYKYGFISWLRLFTLAILVSLIIVFAVILLGSPILVLNMIDLSSVASLNCGDSVTLPTGFAFIRAIMVFFSVFILVYICTAVRFAFVYFYASTKVDIKEREANEIPII